MLTDQIVHTTKKKAFACAMLSKVLFSLVNHRASQVETLFEVLEELDPKLAALGLLEISGTIINGSWATRSLS